MHRLVIALTTLLGLAGAGAVAFFLLFSAAAPDRAAGVAPADTAIYVNLYLQPSSAQQSRIATLLGRLPGFADEATIDEKIDQVAQNLLGQAGLDYATNLKPWLGNQVALAVGAPDPETGTSTTLAIVGVKDRSAAESALAEIAAADGGTPETRSYAGVDLHVTEATTWAFVTDDLLALGPEASSVEAAVDAAGPAPSLADDARFDDAMEGVTDDHLASLYVDLDRLADAAGATDAVAGYSVLAAALVVEEEGLRLDGRAPFDSGSAAASAGAGLALDGEPSSLTDWMPADTRAEVVLSGVRGLIESAEAAAGSAPAGADVENALSTFRALLAFGFGISVDDDILPLLDREAAVAFSGIDEDGLPNGQLLLRPSDPDAAAAALETIVERLEASGASVETQPAGDATVTVMSLPQVGEVAYAVVDGVVVLGLHPEDVMAAIEAHEAGTGLAAGDAYRAAFELAGDRAGNEIWADVTALAELAGLMEGLPADTRDILDQIGAFGFTAPSRETEIEFHAVLTVE